MATVSPFPAPPIPPLGIAPAAWTQALDDAYAKAQQAMPDAGARFAKALALVRAGAVEHAGQWGAYHYSVTSQSDPTGLTSYDVHAQAPMSCTCADWTQQEQKGTSTACKHLLAVWLYRRALDQLPTPQAAPATTPQRGHPPVENPTALALRARDSRGSLPCPEAAFSLSLTGSIGGHHAILTARGQTWEEFRANVARLKGLLDAPAAGQPASQPSAPATSETPACPTHGLMKPSPKVPGTFFCPKKLYDGSYCKERWPQKGA